MSRSSPFVTTPSDADRGELQRRARCYTAPHADVVRAKIVLLAGGWAGQHGDRGTAGCGRGRGAQVMEAVC
jgi:hypothetical protein